MNCALFLIVHLIEYLARMSDLSELIDILDDDGVLHSVDSIDDVEVLHSTLASRVVSPSWVPFIGLFFILH